MVSTRDDTATVGDSFGQDVDAVFTPQTLIFGQGRNIEQCVNVDTIRDNVYERPEQLFVELESSSDAVQLTTQSVAVIISDSMFDRPTVEFVRDNFDLSESSGSVDVCATLDTQGLTIQSVFPVVTFRTQPQSATAPEDYNATTTLLTFQQHNQTLCVAIPIVNDDTPERVEAFTVILSSDNLELPVRLDNGISEATVTIMDDDDVDCGPLTSPLNGTITFPSTNFDSEASYSCDVGFELNGPSERLCQADGEWSGVEPACEIVDCGFPGDPMNPSVRITITGTTFGSEAVYSCDGGLTLVSGDSVRTCLASGRWSSFEPRCVECPALPNPRNGLVTVSGQKATYTCNEGYVNFGGRSRTCRFCLTCPNSAHWVFREPTCLVEVLVGFQFPSYTVLESGRRLLITLLIESVDEDNVEPERELALYFDYFTTTDSSPRPASSLRDYRIVGFTNIVGSDIVFSSHDKNYTFEVEIIDDNVFEGNEDFQLELRGAARHSQDFALRTSAVHEAIVTIIDNDRVRIGFQRSEYSVTEGDESVRVCVEFFNGNRLSQRPITVTVTAGVNGTASDPTDFTNSTFNLIFGIGSSIGSTRCKTIPVIDDGLPEEEESFSLTLTSDLLNVSALELGPSNTTTVIITDNDDCGLLPGILNGQISFSSVTLNSVVTYSCERGFNLVGNSQRVCQANGQWSGMEPSCEIVSCNSSEITPPVNGQVVLSGSSFGSEAIYSCNEGFVLSSGESRRVCQEDTEWSGNEPRCDAIDCGPLLPPTNGSVQFTDTGVNSVAMYQCDEGFNLVEGDQSRTCQLNAMWSGRAPVCEAIDCGLLPSLANGVVNYFNGTGLNSLVTYDCSDGYNLVRGDVSRRCQSDGEWMGNMPTCEAVDCGLLNTSTFTNGRIQYNGGTTFGFEGTYICSEGFTLFGSNTTRMCQANGTWSGNEPQCIAIDCGDLPNPSNGFVVHSGTGFRSMARYSCNNDFVLVGESVRLCEDSGMWTGVEPSCEELMSTTPSAMATQETTTGSASSHTFTTCVSLLASVVIATIMLITV